MREEQPHDGFLIALERGDDEAGQRDALTRLLEFLDDVLGKAAAEVLQKHEIRRLVVLPHRFLRLTPIWALPSWGDLDVRMAPGAASLADAHNVPVLTREALVVTNPTLDLPIATIEGDVTKRRLTDARFEVRALNGTEATEDAVISGLHGAGLLHFAGHGHAALGDGSLSALLVTPEWEKAHLSGPEALVALAHEQGAHRPDDGRSTIDDRRSAPHIVIDQDKGSPRRKIYDEYAKRGTLFADAVHDSVTVAGELWRAGDILVQGSLEGCALAFLCACSSGLGAIEALDEASGLPAALDLAGVGSVVSTGWPVPDALAVLFADEFYARALGQEASTIDLVAAVRATAATLRTMERTEAVERVERLAARAADATSRFRLRAYAKKLRRDGPRPFAHPFDWGAFYITGAARIALESA